MRILLFFLLLLILTTANGATIELNESEKKFVKNHPTIKVSNEMDYPPFDFAINDEPMGYSIDMLNLILSKIDIKAEYVNGYTWDELWKKFEKKEIDLVHPVYHIEYREKFGYYSDPLYRARNVFVVQNDAENIKSMKDLKGKTIATPKGYAITSYLKENLKDATFLDVANQREAIDSVGRGFADVAMGNDAVVSYIVKKDMQTNVKIVGWFAEFDKVQNNNFYYLIRRDWPIFHSLFLKAQNSVMISEIEALQKKWFGENFVDKHKDFKDVYFNNKEREYLSKKGSIKVCVDPDWMPFESLDENGNHIGMSAELLDMVEKRSGIELEIVPTSSWSESIEFAKERKCDIFSLAMKTPKREEYMDFTKPYVSFPFVVATTNDKVFVDNIEALLDKKLAIVEGYAYAEILKKRYPNIELVYVKNLKEGLDKVRDDEVYGYIGALATVAYMIQKEGMTNLKIAGKFDDRWDLSVGVRNDEPLLKSIMQKSLGTLTEPEKINIYNKWYSIKVEENADYGFYWRIIAAITALALLVFLWNLYLRRRIKKEIEKYKKQEALLSQQSKMASMGELIGMIAHQWKQPLNAISLYVQELDDIVEAEGCSKEVVKSTNSKILKQIVHMSNTITHFRNFFKPSNVIEYFDICVVAKEVITLVESKMKSLGVGFYIECGVECKIEGVPNDFKQVLLNIYSNSLDVFADRDRKNPFIKIVVEEKDDVFLVKVQDSGGGIDESLLPEKLFDKYISTKGENGTGIGLQMSKIIIEDKFGGKMSARNIEGGAELLMELPKVHVTKSNK